MAANILEHDQGVVQGTTWHQLPQYLTQDGPVTVDQARKVLDFPLEKVRLYRKAPAGSVRAFMPVDSFAVVRTDFDEVVADAVGPEFVVQNNANILDFIALEVLAEYPELSIESVGTLGNGATSFVNLKLNEFVIPGDKSNTVNRLMYYNPIGLGAYRAGVHGVRIVCQNTLNMADAAAAANGSLTRISHTSNSQERLKEAIIEIGKVFLELKTYEERLTEMAGIDMDSKSVDGFFDAFLPVTEETGQRALKIREKNVGIITSRFETDQDLKNPRTKYGMLNAVTWYVDHVKTQEDDGAQVWDSLTGRRAADKQRAFELLSVN